MERLISIPILSFLRDHIVGLVSGACGDVEAWCIAVCLTAFVQLFWALPPPTSLFVAAGEKVTHKRYDVYMFICASFMWSVLC